MGNLNIKIPSYKTSGSKPIPWITGMICVLVGAFFLYGFSDLSFKLAHIVFARSSISPVIRWLMTLVVLLAYALGLCLFIRMFRRGTKQKYARRDERA